MTSYSVHFVPMPHIIIQALYMPSESLSTILLSVFLPSIQYFIACRSISKDRSYMPCNPSGLMW